MYNISKGSRLRVRMPGGFRLRDQGGRAVEVGEYVTVTQVDKRQSKFYRQYSKERVDCYHIGFAECCGDCRVGKLHHQFWDIESVFQLSPEHGGQVSLGKDGRAYGSEHNGVTPELFKSNSIRAWKVLGAIENITRLWNPDDEDDLTKFTYENYQYKRKKTQEGKILLEVSQFTAGRTYVDVFDAGQLGEDRWEVPYPNMVPSFRAEGVLAYIKGISHITISTFRDMAEFNKLTQELGFDHEEQAGEKT